MSLTQLDLSDNPLRVSGIQSLETAVQAGVLVNLVYLKLSNTLTDDADVNGALLTTLLQSIASHCARLVDLDLSDNNLGLPGLYSVVENISLGLKFIELSTTHLTPSESQYTVACEKKNLHPHSLLMMHLKLSNFSGTAGNLLLAKKLQAFQSLKHLDCTDCSLTSADIIMLIHHLKPANVICNSLNTLDFSHNSIDDEGVMALTECLPELFFRLKGFNLDNIHDCLIKIFSDSFLEDGVALCGNPVSEELILMCNEQLKVLTHNYYCST